MSDHSFSADLTLAMGRACPVYARALAQAVDHGVEIEDAALSMVLFSIGALSAAVGEDRAAHQMSQIAAQFALLSAIFPTARDGGS